LSHLLESPDFLPSSSWTVSHVARSLVHCADLGSTATSSKTASILGAISALFCAGAAFGAVLQGWTSDRFGRRISLAIGGAIAVVGTTVVAAAWNIPMLFVFRFITGLGVGQLLALVPLYIAEVAPPHRRGLLSAATGCSFSLGYLS
jgi:MFS family permease